MSNAITVQTTLALNIRKTWNYFTQPEHIVNWNFASPDWHCPFAENDLRNGGKFKYGMAARDGSFSFDFEGVYDEVIHEQKINYTMPDGRQVMIEFKESDNETTLIETFDPENENSLELQRNGWQAILDNFKKYALAKG